MFQAELNYWDIDIQDNAVEQQVVQIVRQQSSEEDLLLEQPLKSSSNFMPHGPNESGIHDMSDTKQVNAPHNVKGGRDSNANQIIDLDDDDGGLGWQDIEDDHPQGDPGLINIVWPSQNADIIDE